LGHDKSIILLSTFHPKKKQSISFAATKAGKSFLHQHSFEHSCWNKAPDDSKQKTTDRASRNWEGHQITQTSRQLRQISSFFKYLPHGDNNEPRKEKKVLQQKLKEKK
jgi:hypothetical protein